MKSPSARRTSWGPRRNNVVQLQARRREHRRTARKTAISRLAGVIAAIGIGAATPLAASAILPLANRAPDTAGQFAEIRHDIATCSGGARKARKVTCIVDGDTGWQDGIKWRMKGIDAPELSSPSCNHEHRKAVRARDRLRDLMQSGYRLE